MKKLFIIAFTAMFFSLGTVSAADPAPKKEPPKCPCTGQAVCNCDKSKNCKCTATEKKEAKKCPCTGQAVCNCDKSKNCKCTASTDTTKAKKQEPVKKPVSQSIIKRVTNPVLDGQKKRDQQLLDEGLL